MTECPSCGSEEIHEVICSGENTEEGVAQGMKQLDLYPIRPAETLECQECKWRWPNPDFEKYLAQKTIKQGMIR